MNSTKTFERNPSESCRNRVKKEQPVLPFIIKCNLNLSKTKFVLNCSCNAPINVKLLGGGGGEAGHRRGI